MLTEAKRAGFPDDLALVVYTDGAANLERFEITEQCHRQIASRLQIPWTYYDRIKADHRDLLIHQVNALFNREPETRLVRTLDGKARAFLSDRYRPIDNAEVLEQVLPPLVTGQVPSRLLSSEVTEDKMYLKVVFTGDELRQDIGAAKGGNVIPMNRPGHEWIGRDDTNGGRDIVRPGLIISNSETAKGALNMRGFFWRALCDNGCVYGERGAFDYTRNHVGGKLAIGEIQFSDETRRKQNEVTIAELGDVFNQMSSAEHAQRMGDVLRAAANGEEIKDAFGAVEVLAREVTLRDTEKKSVLTSLLAGGDLSRWGMVNAVTSVANSEAVTYERACELEDIGGKLLAMELKEWHKVAVAIAA
jgi:hypothetical protein